MNLRENRYRFAICLATMIALAPAALAHEGEYDPLVVDLHAFLTEDGRIDERAPGAGAIAFPASTPAAPGAPLRFAFDAPVRFAPGAPFAVTLKLRADAPVVARDAEGNALEINVEPGGTAVRVPFDSPVLAPATVLTVSASVQAPSALFAEGDPVTLVVRPLVPVTDGALWLVIGADASTFTAPDMRVPTPADLRLQDVGHTEFLLEGESFEPPATHAVNVFEVLHEGIRVPNPPSWSAAGTYVVLRGAELPNEALQHSFPDRARRVEAAHELKVNGVTARAHPGLGVVVRVGALPILVECVRNCPTGFTWTHAPAVATPSSTAEGPGVLVPPQRDTTGIPVSEDETKETPIPFGGAFGVMLALALALTLSKR